MGFTIKYNRRAGNAVNPQNQTLKKGWFKMNMTHPWFYVEDERGNQLVEPDFQETHVYGEAEKMARKMSRERGIKTRVNVLISPHFFVNGRLKKEF